MPYVDGINVYMLDPSKLLPRHGTDSKSVAFKVQIFNVHIVTICKQMLSVTIAQLKIWFCP